MRISSSGRKLTRYINHNPTVYSQERHQDDTQSSSTRKLGRKNESLNSARARKLERCEDIQFGRSKLHFHTMHISNFRYFEKVFKHPRKSLNVAEDAPVIGIEELKTIVLIWGLFESTTMKASIHLGPNYVEILEVYRNTNFEGLQNLFDVTQKLILDIQAEILNVTPIGWTAPSWTRSTLSRDQVIT